MNRQEVDVIVIGAGAAGLAAARRLGAESLTLVVLEAANRVGGRAWTPERADGLVLDLGCGWLHSADVNPWTRIAADLGFDIDRTGPRWGEQSGGVGFTPQEQKSYRRAAEAFHARLARGAHEADDRPASDFLEPGGRWNALLNTVSTFVSGVELDRVSARDLANYSDTGLNWRVRQGYGTAIAAFGAAVPVELGARVSRIDHSGRLIRVVTAKGDLFARAVVITLSSALIAAGRVAFDPELPDKMEAASGLPLGIADKVVLALDEPDAFAVDGHLFGRTDEVGTGGYHLRPFGQPVIEAFVGGRNAYDLERAGPGAREAFVLDELAALCGEGVRTRMRAIAETAWSLDPLALGSYSCALPGRADARRALAAPVGQRLFFAGEACSTSDFSTAHGAYRTGVEAAEAVVRALLPEGSAARAR